MYIKIIEYAFLIWDYTSLELMNLPVVTNQLPKQINKQANKTQKNPDQPIP